jgi:hypothetical protein
VLRQLKRSQYVVLCLFATLIFTTPAAAGLMGSTVSWQYYYGGGAYTFPGGNTGGPFVVSGGVGGIFVGGSSYLYFQILAADTSITFDYSIGNVGSGTWSDSPLSLLPTIYNGVAIDMISGPALTGVTVDPLTNMVGFDASRVSFTGSQIQVDWVGLGFSTDTIVKLDVDSGPTVPEPGSYLLFGSGLLAVALWRRKS